MCVPVASEHTQTGFPQASGSSLGPATSSRTQHTEMHDNEQDLALFSSRTPDNLMDDNIEENQYSPTDAPSPPPPNDFMHAFTDWDGQDGPIDGPDPFDQQSDTPYSSATPNHVPQPNAALLKHLYSRLITAN